MGLPQNPDARNWHVTIEWGILEGTMRAHVAAVGVCLLLAACGGSDSEPDGEGSLRPSTTTSPSVPPPSHPEPSVVGGRLPPSDINRTQIGLRDLGFVDPGVATSLTVWGKDDYLQDGSTVPVDDVSIVLERCHLRAPGEWVVEGRATFDGLGPAKAWLGFGAGTRVDVFDFGVPVLVTFAKSGAFSLLVSGYELHRAMPPARQSAALEPFFSEETCNIGVGSDGVQVAEVRRTAASDPLEWDAPTDTLQSLGAGVVLSDPGDMRIPFAYLAWGQHSFSMPTVWVPELPGMRLIDVAMNGEACSIVRFDSSGTVRVSDPEHGIFVSHFRNCDFTDLLMPGRGPATSVAGFTFDETLGTRGIVADLDGTLVSVESLSASIEELEAVAASLVPYRNMHTKP